jgi:hypothetical protein
VRGVSMHARGLRLRGVQRMLAITHPPVLPSAILNGVDTPVAIISQLNTLPALPPVNASMAALRLATHDSGPGRLATPFLYDSFIHNSTPVLSRRTQQLVRRLIYTDAELRMKEVEMDSDTTKYMEFRAKAEEAALDLRLVETEII